MKSLAFVWHPLPAGENTGWKPVPHLLRRTDRVRCTPREIELCRFETLLGGYPPGAWEDAPVPRQYSIMGLRRPVSSASVPVQ